MRIEDIKKNISNLKRWLLERPKDEDYLRLLNEFENLENNYVQKN